jgi:hypothetical protein
MKISKNFLHIAMETVHKLRINCVMILRASTRGSSSSIFKNQGMGDADALQLGLTGIFALLICGVNSGPVNPTLGISAWCLVLNPPSTFFLTAVFEFAVVTVFPIVIGVVSTRVVSQLGLRNSVEVCLSFIDSADNKFLFSLLKCCNFFIVVVFNYFLSFDGLAIGHGHPFFIHFSLLSNDNVIYWHYC